MTTQQVTDSLTNYVAQLGTARDKASHSFYGMQRMNPVEALNAYRGSWAAKKIINIPADDSVTKWRSWMADRKTIERIEAEEKRLNLKLKIRDARRLARLTGGAAIYIGVANDTNLEKPLNVDAVRRGGLRYLTIMSRSELTAGDRGRDVLDPLYGRPLWYTVQNSSLRIHPSRFALFYGDRTPQGQQAAYGSLDDGWGESVLLAVMSAIKNNDATDENIASLIFEANVDVVKIPNLMDRISDPVYREKLLERGRLAGMTKGINGMFMLDDQETYERKSVSFATLPDVQDRFMQRLCGAADIPQTRFLSQTPTGLSNNGSGDLENYYDRISADQQLEISPAIEILDECLIRSATGERDPKVHYVWRSLFKTKPKERAEIAKLTADTLKTIKDTGLYHDEVLAKAGVTLLVETETMPGIEQAMAEDVTERAPVPTDANGTKLTDAAPAPLYVSRRVKNSAEILEFYRAQGLNPQDDLHVTIAYSRTPVDWFKVGEAWDSEKELAEGGPRAMDKFGDALVLLFAASDLSYRHGQIVRAGASWDHPDYQPHLTINYAAKDIQLDAVKPWRGKIILGPEIFEPLDTDWSANKS